MTDRATAIDRVALLVPAWNEEATITRCLGHLAVAAERVAPLPVSLVLVADRCTDRTVDRGTHTWPGELVVVDVIAGSAGRARHLGARFLLENLGETATTTWIATTDADSFVPPDWLATQLRLASRGFDGVAGTIDLDSWDVLPPDARSRYRSMLDRARTPHGQHTDVFAANLGARASALAAVGGFPDIPCGEDHAVWSALRSSGRRVTAPADLVVTTSGRLAGRAVGGLADLLGDLAAAELAEAAREPA